MEKIVNSSGMRVKNKCFTILILFLLVSLTPAKGNICYVDCNGPNEPGTGTFADPFRHIQDGIDAATAGDRIQINMGVYTEPGNYNLDPNGKAITISSSDPNNPDIARQTVIDPNHAGRGFYIHSGEDTNCIISGLTITNADTDSIGGGIYCLQSSPVITGCFIIDNNATGYGGGLYCEDSNIIIQNCVIKNNRALDGASISGRSGSILLSNCIISNNHARRYGAGLDCYLQFNPTINSCSFVGNNSGEGGAGGAINLWASHANINNTIFWANKAEIGTQLLLIPGSGSSAAINYCVVQDGNEGVYDIEGNVIWGNGNFESDPCFAYFDPTGDPNQWDLHLKSKDGRYSPDARPAVDLTQNGIVDLKDFAVMGDLWQQEGKGLVSDLDSNGKVDFLDLQLLLDEYLEYQSLVYWVYDESNSFCLDAGDPSSDWDAEPWPNGKRINMGAYGGTYQASKKGNKADFDINGNVNFMDFAMLSDRWSSEGFLIEDLNVDGVVDVDDLVIFTDNWLWQSE